MMVHQKSNVMPLNIDVCESDTLRHGTKNLLGDREGLVVELLDELGGHLV